LHYGLRSYSLIEDLAHRASLKPGSRQATPICRRGKAHATSASQSQAAWEDTMEQNATPNKQPYEISEDILTGAEAVAEFLFGSKKDRRKVYYLAECTRIPIFRLGSVICARRSVLLRWIAEQESRVR
jgi:hypothetical protein